MSARASASEVPNGFSMIARTSKSSERASPAAPRARDDHREELGRGREVEGARHRLAGDGVELLERGGDVGVGVGVAEAARHVAQLREQAVEHAVVGRRAREAADRLGRHLAVLLVGHLAARDPDQVEVARQGALVREVVDRRQQLAPREVAGGAEDHEVRRRDRQALEPPGERIGLEVGRDRHVPLGFTAWPPNWLRRAASTRAL